MSPGVRGLVLALCVIGVPWVARAQQTVDTGTIAGRIVDEQGAVVPGAAVTIRQADTGIARTAVTGSDGRFRFTYLQVGAYTIDVTLAGFADAHRALTVQAGSSFELPIQLSLAKVDTTVTVTADTPVVEAARSQIAATLGIKEIATLPMDDRNFQDLALLAPGVAPANTASTQLFAETSAVPGAGISVGSQRNFSNSFIVDGLSANDDAAGLGGMPYSVDAIDQFQVVTSGGQAELGRALGGYVNVVTRSGGNRFAGDAFGYFKDDRLNAANALSGTKLPMDQQQFGGSAGGPIVRNRTFFFANVERRDLDQTGLVTIDPAAAAAINQRLSAVAYPGLPVRTGAYPNPVRTTNYLAKVDHQASPGDHMTSRFALYDANSSNARGAGGLNAATASADLDNLDQAVAFSNTAILSPHTVMETRAQFAHGDLKAPPSDPIGPAVTIAGVASFGTLSFSPTRRVNSLFELSDSLSHQAGNHALRAGVDLLYNADDITFPRAARGAYTFASLDAFLRGIYNAAGFTQAFGDSVVSQRNPNIGIYVQDEWKAARDLTINAGVRYDLQFVQTIRTDTNNVGPRVGVAWVPSASRRTVVRGGAGLYFDRVPLRALANALLSAGNTSDPAALRQVIVSLSPDQAGAPVFPNALAGPVQSVTLPTMTTMDPRMRNAYSRQANVEVERQIGQRSTATLGYQYTRGEDLIISINQNVPTCAATGTNNGCRPNPAAGNINQYSPSASSSYHGLYATFVARPATWGHYRVSYTLSKAMSNVGEFFFSSPIDPFDLSRDWGRADDDRRHRLAVSGALALPAAFEVSGSIRAYSSLPLNVTSGLTTIEGTAARPLVNGAFVSRNAGTGPDFFTLDLRLARRMRFARNVRVDAFLEAFNVTNRANAVAMNGTFGTGAYPNDPAPSFGRVTAVDDPRTLQVGVRVNFGGRVQ